MLKKRLFAALLPCIIAFTSSTNADSYGLQPGDRIQLTVIGVKELGHQATVQTDGTLRLPLIGRLEVAGTNIDELKSTLAAVFAEREGIRPDAVLIQIVDYRPLYVIGASQSGKLIPFRPGLTALQTAIQASSEDNSDKLRLIEKLEAGRTTGTAEQAEERLAAALINRARLLAERNDTELVLPERPENFDDERWELLRERGSQMLMQQRASYDKLVNRLDALETVLEKRVQALSDERNLQEQAISVVQEELDSLTRSDLRGLVTQDRLNSVRVRLFDAQLNRLRLLSDSAAAQSDVTLINQERAQSRQQRNLEIAAELERLETEIGTLTVSLAQARLDRSLVRSETRRSDNEETNIFAARFFVHRKSDVNSELEIEAVLPGDFLRPGDILEVRY